MCTLPVTNCHRFVTSRAKAWQLSPAHLPTSLIPQKPFDGVTWAEVFHEMDEGTRSPDRANDGVRSIGDRQDAGGREDGHDVGCPVSVETSETIHGRSRPDAALPTLIAAGGDAAPRPMVARSGRIEGRNATGDIEAAHLARPDLREDFQSEIRARVANFRAHRERFNREREALLQRDHGEGPRSLRESEPPTRPGKK